MPLSSTAVLLSPGCVAGFVSRASAMRSSGSTVAVTRRETNGWKWPAFMLAYLFGLAYLASFITYRVALYLGG